MKQRFCLAHTALLPFRLPLRCDAGDDGNDTFDSGLKLMQVEPVVLGAFLIEYYPFVSEPDRFGLEDVQDRITGESLVSESF